MNYVVTILTEKYLYRVNIEGGIKYTLGSGKKDLFPMSELGIDGQLGMCFNEKKQVLKLTAKTIPLSVKEINEEARLVHICGYPKIEVSFTRDTGEYPESYAIPYECQIHIGRSKKNDIVLNESYVSRNHLLITAEKGRIRIEDLESTYGTYLNGSPVKKAMLKSGDEIDICDLRMICKENRLYFYNLHETPEFKYQKEINHPGMATDIVSTRKGYPIYHRSPRIRESLPVDEVRLSHLPNKPQKFSIRKANFLPLLSSGAMAGASIAMSTFSPAMLAMRAAMMISPVGSLIGNSNKKARKMLMVEEEERFRKYADYIAGEKAHIRAIGEKQREITNQENPAPEICETILNKMSTSLWERTATDARLSEVEKVQDVFAQILKELMSRMQRRKEAATEIEKEPWIILLIDDIKECNSLPDDIQMQLHRIMTKTKGYGVLVLCGIRQGDLFNFYTQDQLGVDLKSSGSALALSDTAVHYEGFYKNNFAQSQRNAELEKGFGIFFTDNGGRKIKCIDSQEAGR